METRKWAQKNRDNKATGKRFLMFMKRSIRQNRGHHAIFSYRGCYYTHHLYLAFFKINSYTL